MRGPRRRARADRGSREGAGREDPDIRRRALQFPWHEKTLGQLFCDTSAKDIIAMLLSELQAAKAELRLNTSVGDVAARDGAFEVTLESDGATRPVRVQNLVVATGG